ncbi:WecB/TagA/CpsF family glycosyltransferase [Lutibacter flavus]|uniref:N-acetylglucosaminyldiphosphoundecaprenol N-acetyl-beta-D-mannosaminyltransferase n=1 Tax=Lutibacter flavus TaxID=691689 RepID=A0A238VRS9_9FLAO|nr:WecB/TagA/CpsF family glycosyltransferase [Lutibacter flavus]SNR36946.1 N-acetylglucosaminyldiphosphoundecaprenol N-acetyl-beta-D-mannosaminyltransferase [Lutibacter flavus]
MDLKKVVNQFIYTASLSEIRTGKKCIINTINPHSFCEAKKDKQFAEALLSGDVLLPDGSGIVLATKILTGSKINKIAGADIHQYLLEKANLKNQKVFYLGASEKTLQLISNKIKIEFPNIKMESYSPPYKPEFSELDTSLMTSSVNNFKPDILFVGMTAPKQEKWVYANKDNIDASIIVSIGAVFDFYAGTVKRSSPFWINLGLEWLPRLVKEPRRLWKRNFVSTPLFLVYLIKEKFFSF